MLKLSVAGIFGIILALPPNFTLGAQPAGGNLSCVWDEKVLVGQQFQRVYSFQVTLEIPQKKHRGKSWVAGENKSGTDSRNQWLHAEAPELEL